MATFKIGGEEYEVKVPKGKKGRKATNYLLAKFGNEEESGFDLTGIINLLDESQFEDVHLPALLGLDKKFLEEEGTTAELIAAITTVISELFKGFETEEMQAALGNSEEAQEEGS